MKAVVGVFDNDHDAEWALDELAKNGFGKDKIETVVTGSDEAGSDLQEGQGSGDRSEPRGSSDPSDSFPATPIGVIPAAIPGGIVGVPTGQNAGGLNTGFIPVPLGINLKARLTDLGVDEDDAAFFARDAKRDGILIVVKADRDQVDRVVQIMRDANGKTRDTDAEVSRHK